MRRSVLAPPLVALMVLVAAACSPGGADWGPLAVIDDDGSSGGDALGGTGPLRIGQRCVTLTTEEGFELTLVWPRGTTQWNEDIRSIEFGSGSDVMTLTDGTTVSVGGSGELSEDPDWIAEPDESCPKATFLVSSIEPGS